MSTASPPPDPTALAVDSHGAAALLGVSESHWRIMTAAGRCPPGIRLGRRRLWAVDDLRAWLQAGSPPADKWAAMKK
jgi:predicted DNA-binding transcriptional regulator AlpA